MSSSAPCADVNAPYKRNAELTQWTLYINHKTWPRCVKTKKNTLFWISAVENNRLDALSQGADIRRFYRVGMVLSKPWAWIQGNLLHCYKRMRNLEGEKGAKPYNRNK